MTFDPDSVTPSSVLVDHWQHSEVPGSIYQLCVLAARWGAAQAVEALRHQWPEWITDREPTAEDADEDGWVQTLSDGRIDTTAFGHTNGLPWLHTPNWRPKPEPTPKEQALNLLDGAEFETDFTHEQIALLRQVVESAPDTAP